MEHNPQNQDGRYHSTLYNTPPIRGQFYNLLEELCKGDDFRYLIQPIKRGVRSDVHFNNGNMERKLDGKTISEFLEQNYQNGHKNIEVAFSTENSRLFKVYENGDLINEQAGIPINFGMDFRKSKS